MLTVIRSSFLNSVNSCPVYLDSCIFLCHLKKLQLFHLVQWYFEKLQTVYLINCVFWWSWWLSARTRVCNVSWWRWCNAKCDWHLNAVCTCEGLTLERRDRTINMDKLKARDLEKHRADRLSHSVLGKRISQLYFLLLISSFLVPCGCLISLWPSGANIYFPWYHAATFIFMANWLSQISQFFIVLCHGVGLCFITTRYVLSILCNLNTQTTRT